MRQRIIILDGPDSCGKSEMATALSEVTGIPYFKNTSEWDAFENDPSYFINALRYGDSYFFNYLKQTKSNVILDRSYPSEWVYSKVFNRQTDEIFLKQIDDLASELDARIVIPYRTTYSGIHDKVHQIDDKKLEELSKVYEDFAAWTSCKTLRLCVDTESIGYELKEILRFMRNK